MTLLKGRIKVPSGLAYFNSNYIYEIMKNLLYNYIWEKRVWNVLRGSQWRKEKILYRTQAHKPNMYENRLLVTAAAAAKSLQSCPTLWDPRDGSPPGSPIPGILQARTLEWVAISFSNAWKWKGKVKSLSGVWLFATPWTSAHLALPSMRFSRQEYWSGVPSPSPQAHQNSNEGIRLHLLIEH